MRIVFIGAVGSSECALEKLIEHQMDVVGVFGLDVDGPHNVSGYVSLGNSATKAGIAFHPFKKINDHADDIRALKPDMIFVVGLSQLISDDVIQCPTICCVGFHPTVLPSGRGRGPLAWLVLEERQGASTFFQIAQGVDDGPIFVQEKFDIEENDDAASVEQKCLLAIRAGLDRWLPVLKRGEVVSVDQDESKASYYGRRSPEDGLIAWDQPAERIDRLIKSATHPHPGAFTYCDNKKVTIWSSSIEREARIKGVVGRIVKIQDDSLLIVQCGSGLLRVNEYEVEDGSRLTVGKKLGFYADLEIYKLQQEIARLKAQMDQLNKHS